MAVRGLRWPATHRGCVFPCRSKLRVSVPTGVTLFGRLYDTHQHKGVQNSPKCGESVVTEWQEGFSPVSLPRVWALAQSVICEIKVI